LETYISQIDKRPNTAIVDRVVSRSPQDRLFLFKAKNVRFQTEVMELYGNQVLHCMDVSGVDWIGDVTVNVLSWMSGPQIITIGPFKNTREMGTAVVAAYLKKYPSDLDKTFIIDKIQVAQEDIERSLKLLAQFALDEPQYEWKEIKGQLDNKTPEYYFANVLQDGGLIVPFKGLPYQLPLEQTKYRRAPNHTNGVMLMTVEKQNILAEYKKWWEAHRDKVCWDDKLQQAYFIEDP
jgi:hypothetical protein